MKTATVTEAGLDFLSVLKWVETGEEVQVVREGKPVAVISPAPRETS
jgi:prevent-host-death family protein